MTEPIKEGFMEKRFHKGRMGKQWTKRWVLLYDVSDSGVPRLETFDSKEQAKKDSSKGMIIALNTDVHKIISNQVANKRDFTIDIVMGGDKVHTFAVDTKAEQDQWLDLMRRVANLGGKRCSLTPPTKHGSNRYDTHNPHKPLEGRLSSSSTDDTFFAEENTMYDSYEVKQYHVRIRDNDFTRSQLKLNGAYILCLDSLKLTLVHKTQGNMLYSWPYKYLRRYGRDKTSFSMEAGRKCQSGPGLIVFETPEGNAIFHEIQNFVNSLSTSQPMNLGHQQVKKDERMHGSHENLHSKVKHPAVENIPPAVQPRSHSLSTSKSLTQTPEFKNRIAQRKAERYELQSPVPNKPKVHAKPPDLNRTVSSPVDQIYSEVSDQQTDEGDHPRMPPGTRGANQEPYNGEYDFASELKSSHGPLPPDSDEYDELHPTTLYTNPKSEIKNGGDAWKTFALPKDNIHTETYISGRPGEPDLIQKASRRSKESPKVKPRKPQVVNDSLYSVASSATGSTTPPTKPSTPTPAGNEVYDHLARVQNIPKPKPVPRRAGPSSSTSRPPQPSKPARKSPPVQHHGGAQIYDHLERQQAKPPASAKPNIHPKKPSKPDPNATYGQLFEKDQKVEESAYGHLCQSSDEPVDVAKDKAGYLTRADIAEDYPNDIEYDELADVRAAKDNGESIYDLPEDL